MQSRDEIPHFGEPDFIFKTQIQESHIDMLGHVNNAFYLQLFEQARWSFITDNGYGLERIMATKQSPVVLEVNLKFKKELKNREAIEIRSYMKGWRGKIGQIYQEIVNSEDIISCSGLFTIGFFDMESRKLINVSEEFERALKPPQK